MSECEAIEIMLCDKIIIYLKLLLISSFIYIIYK